MCGIIKVAHGFFIGLGGKKSVFTVCIRVLLEAWAPTRNRNVSVLPGSGLKDFSLNLSVRALNPKP